MATTHYNEFQDLASNYSNSRGWNSFDTSSLKTQQDWENYVYGFNASSDVESYMAEHDINNLFRNKQYSQRLQNIADAEQQRRINLYNSWKDRTLNSASGQVAENAKAGINSDLAGLSGGTYSQSPNAVNHEMPGDDILPAIQTGLSFLGSFSGLIESGFSIADKIQSIGLKNAQLTDKADKFASFDILRNAVGTSNELLNLIGSKDDKELNAYLKSSGFDQLVASQKSSSYVPFSKPGNQFQRMANRMAKRYKNSDMFRSDLINYASGRANDVLNYDSLSYLLNGNQDYAKMMSQLMSDTLTAEITGAKATTKENKNRYQTADVYGAPDENGISGAMYEGKYKSASAKFGLNQLVSSKTLLSKFAEHIEANKDNPGRLFFWTFMSNQLMNTATQTLGQSGANALMQSKEAIGLIKAIRSITHPGKSALKSALK